MIWLLIGLGYVLGCVVVFAVQVRINWGCIRYHIGMVFGDAALHSLWWPVTAVRLVRWWRTR